MSLTEIQVDENFAAFGLPAPPPAEMFALEAIPDTFVAEQTIIDLPQVQSEVLPVAQMFYLATDHGATSATLSSMVQSSLTESQLAAALVSSQAFANVNNGGVLLDPNAPVSESLVEVLFIRDLGHAPSEATLAGFEGMSNAQAFLAFSTSETVTNALAPTINTYLIQVQELASGVPMGDPIASSVQIVGQAGTAHLAG
jgi:hypothetical protein